jgi:hypothetical protein
MRYVAGAGLGSRGESEWRKVRSNGVEEQQFSISLLVISTTARNIIQLVCLISHLEKRCILSPCAHCPEA